MKRFFFCKPLSPLRGAKPTSRQMRLRFKDPKSETRDVLMSILFPSVCSSCYKKLASIARQTPTARCRILPQSCLRSVEDPAGIVNAIRRDDLSVTHLDFENRHSRM